MTVEELANKRYGGEFVFMFGHLEGRTRFVFECFDPRPDHEGKNTYMVSYFEKELRRRVSMLVYQQRRKAKNFIVVKLFLEMIS